jgi:hypothetical protein
LATEKMAALQIDPLDKFTLAIEHHVPQWLLPVFNELIQRAEPMGTEDVRRVGLDYALKIAAIRERRTETRRGLAPRGRIDIDYTSTIRAVFEI